MTAPATPAAPAQEPPATPPAAAPAPPAQAATPPWGTEENFNAEKAWTLIEGLRADKEKLAARPTLNDEQKQQLAEYQALVEASKSEQQRKDEALAAKDRELEQTRAEAVRYKAAAAHGIGAEHFDLLGTGTDEEVSARAEKLAALLAAQAQVAPGTTPPPATRPVEQLRPGATPGQAVDEDELTYTTLFGPPK